MCGRYTLARPSPADVRARFPVRESLEIRRRYNVAPGDEVLAVTTDEHGAPRGQLLRWGLVPSWSNSPEVGPKMINARAETVAERPAFKGALERRRCLVVADGFYEWRRPQSGPKRPFHITRRDGALFAFAGLWSTWNRADGTSLRTCAILTTASNLVIAPLHDRMPAILEPDAEELWLDPSSTAPQLTPALRGLGADQTALHPVGPAVNDARNDGPECLAPPRPEQQAALF
jgi:putative SOS response-associated peptidase YedK